MIELDCSLNDIGSLAPVSVSGLNVGEKAYTISRLQGQTICVVPDILFAEHLKNELDGLGVTADILETKLPLMRVENLDIYERYTDVISSFVSGTTRVLIILPEVTIQRIPSPEYFSNSSITLRVGESIDIGLLKKRLITLGYTKELVVSSPGQFAVIGDVVDVYMGEHPLRIHFFDDEIEQINTFDKDEYKVIEKLDECSIKCKTFLMGIDQEAFEIENKIKKSVALSKLESGSLLRLNEVVGEELERLKNTSPTPCFVLPYMDMFNTSILDLADNIVFDEPRLITDKLYQLIKEENSAIDELIKAGEFLPKHRDFYNFKPFDCIDNKKLYAFCRLVSVNRIFVPKNFVEVDCLSLYSYTNNYSKLTQDMLWYLKQDFKIVLCCGDEYNKSKIASCFEPEDINIGEELVQDKVNITTWALPYHIALEQEKILIVGTSELVVQTPGSKKSKKVDNGFLPKVGDYVVHEVQGIGKCVGIEKLKLTTSLKDYVIIEYRGGDILYVPTENIGVLSAYVGSDNPKCNKLGGDDFYKTKQKAKESIKKMAFDLIQVYADKESSKGFRYSQDSYLQQEFEKAFKFTYTDDQIEAINAIKRDMEGTKIMDRLICGDVGFGKTEVALVAAYKAIQDGKQVAFIAPTTILSEQHYNTCISRMRDFMVRVGVVNRLHDNASQKDTLDKLARGEIDIIVGTHRLLSKDVKFKDLGLLILDEEQRFGVEHKETLRNLKRNLDVLTLSATPIPRTLYMSLSGIRDISYLNTPPKSRQPVETYVVDYNENMIVSACKRELERNGQILIVYNRVETIYDFAAKVKKMLPDVEIAVAHGQMPSKTLEDVIYRVYNRQVNVLISTVLIENGVDLPYANTLIVIDSDKLGLSQLYQLKGRIGRSDLSSFAYFTFERNKALTEEAYKRLDALMEFTKLGSGLKVAMRDLQIRGAGNILGKEQHGHMDKIGYYLYFKLLEQAVKELKGEKSIERSDVKIDTGLNAYISDKYITDEEARIVYYSKISGIISRQELDGVIDDLKNQYGEVPMATVELCKIALIKNLASRIGASRVIINRDIVSITLNKTDDFVKSSLYDYINSSNICKLYYKNEPKIIFDHDGDIDKSQEMLIDFLTKSQLVAK